MKSISLYKEYEFSMKNSKYVEFPKFLYYDLQGRSSMSWQDELKYRNVVNEYGSKPLRISYPLFVYNGLEGSCPDSFY